MGRNLKTVEEIQVAGNSARLTKTQLNDRREAESAPLSGSQRAELKRIDELISETLAACGRGQVVRSKRGSKKNPAFQNLLTLTKVRDLIRKNKIEPQKQSVEDILASADEFLKGTNNDECRSRASD